LVNHIPFNNLKAQHEPIAAEVQLAFDEVFASGQFILGPQGLALEAEFAAFCGVSHAVGVSSGTDALWLALVALGVKPGDEVITTSNTALATVAAIRHETGSRKWTIFAVSYSTALAWVVAFAIYQGGRLLGL
jgi:dTDP-4-amino-4,6-dideoxygalactose transaminase